VWPRLDLWSRNWLRALEEAISGTGLPHIINSMHGFIPSSDGVRLILCQVVHSGERRGCEWCANGKCFSQFAGLVARDSPKENKYVVPLEPVCS